MNIKEVSKLTLHQAERLLYLLDINQRAKNRTGLAISSLQNADEKTSKQIWKALG